MAIEEWGSSDSSFGRMHPPADYIATEKMLTVEAPAVVGTPLITLVALSRTEAFAQAYRREFAAALREFEELWAKYEAGAVSDAVRRDLPTDSTSLPPWLNSYPQTNVA